MTNILNGRAYADELIEQAKITVRDIMDNGHILTLAIVSVGVDQGWKQYVSSIVRVCNIVGIKVQEYDYDKSISQNQLLAKIDDLNNNHSITGIFVQYPLPKHIDSDLIYDMIQPNKDIDGQSSQNIANLYRGKKCIVSATAQSVVSLLEHYNIVLEGKKCVVIGRSVSVGKPLSLLLLQHNATVSICHSKTNDLSLYTCNADIICCAVGKPKFITADMVSNGSIVVDIGTNFVDGKMCGDVDFDNVSKKCQFISPVPNGVAAVTTIKLICNIITAFELQ